MASETQFHVHHDSPEKVGRRERLGVRLLIVADGAFAFGLIFSYFYLRNLNNNGGWIPKGGHTFGASSGWMAMAPAIIAGIIYQISLRSGKSFAVLNIANFLLYVYGGYYVWHQLSHMPFISKDTGGFEGAYGSMWALIAGAGLFHYLLSLFISLGLIIRAQRGLENPALTVWRHRTAGSWFTWVAISGVLLALTTSFI
jgi:heme/copper-type cytochrome/quinol oxidase subunit 3